MEGIKRQTLLRSSYPCDLYFGEDLSSHVAALLKRFNPLRCKVVLMYDDSCDSYLHEKLSRSIIDADYTLVELPTSLLPEDVASINALVSVLDVLMDNEINADDIILAVGSRELLSLVNYTISFYRSDVGFVAYPLDILAAYTVGIAPLLLKIQGYPCMTSDPRSHQIWHDWSYLDKDVENRQYLLSILFKGSIAAGDELYRWLYEFADRLCSSNSETELWRTALPMGLHELASSKNKDWAEQIIDTFKQMLPDAERQAVIYETVLFSIRLAIAHGKSSIEFLHELEEYIKKLNYTSSFSVTFSGEELYDAMKENLFKEHNRLLIQVPVSVGVVQPVLIQDEILRSHCNAWVKTHSKQLNCFYIANNSNN